MKRKAFTLEKKLIAQVRYYETLYLVYDAHGERIYTGSEEAAKRVLKVLNGDAGKAEARRSWEGRTTLARAKAVVKRRR